jgi:hypothetical protein
MPTKSGAGFDKNPQNINRNGRPKKNQAMTKILADVLDEENVNYKGQKISGKEAVARKMLELAMTGDVPALKYIYDRLDGTPRQSVELTGEDGGPIMIGREFDNL